MPTVKNFQMACLMPLNAVTKLSQLSLAILAYLTPCFLSIALSRLTVAKSRLPQTSKIHQLRGSHSNFVSPSVDN